MIIVFNMSIINWHFRVFSQYMAWQVVLSDIRHYTHFTFASSIIYLFVLEGGNVMNPEDIRKTVKTRYDKFAESGGNKESC
jgi:hypothetical protein